MAFPTTQWSLLAQATANGGATEREALAEFFRRYREPVVAFVARARPGRNDAEDVAQNFFVALMEGSFLRRADRARGRFRSFLIGALLRHLAREDERSAAAKRGGDTERASWDELADAELPGAAPEVLRAFDREWALALLGRVRAGVEAGLAERHGRGAAMLMRFLPGATNTPSYDAAARELGWTLAKLKTEVFRVREDFRAAVRAEVALTVDSPEEIETELACLHQALAGDVA